MKQLDYGKGSLPLYLQIKNIIKAKITSGKFAYGDSIPSELQLQSTYNVSRITARQAIVDLEREGYVERKRGRGTRVIYQKQIEEELTRVMSFTNEMKTRGLVPQTIYAHIEKVKAIDKVAEIFEIAENEEILCLKRIRTSDGVPIAYFETYFEKNIGLPEEDSYYMDSVYALMDEYGIKKPVSSTERISATLATAELAKHLEIKKNSAILVRSRVSYAQDKSVVEFTTVYYPAARYSYIISSMENHR